MSFALSPRSRSRLLGVHPDLIRVVESAILVSPLDFMVVEGRRDKTRQAALVKAGLSRTMNSRHLTGHAVDLAVLLNGEVRWDWPGYRILAKMMKETAAKLGIPLEWGGDWKTFPDGPHFQLPFASYPT